MNTLRVIMLLLVFIPVVISITPYTVLTYHENPLITIRGIEKLERERQIESESESQKKNKESYPATVVRPEPKVRRCPIGQKPPTNCKPCTPHEPCKPKSDPKNIGNVKCCPHFKDTDKFAGYCCIPLNNYKA